MINACWEVASSNMYTLTLLLFQLSLSHVMFYFLSHCFTWRPGQFEYVLHHVACSQKEFPSLVAGNWLMLWICSIQYIPRNMHSVFALLCFVVVIHWLIFSYPSGLLHWHCGNLTIAPVPAKQPWWIWINTSCEFIMNDCITTTKQSTTKSCAYFLGYTVNHVDCLVQDCSNSIANALQSCTKSLMLEIRWQLCIIEAEL